MLVRSSNGSYGFIDFRETAPAAAFQDMYKGNVNASLYGGLARSVEHHLTSVVLTGVSVGFLARFVAWNICTKATVNCLGLI